MASYSSRLDNLIIPVLIPKKGKGHREVHGVFSVATSTYVEPEQFIQPVTAACKAEGETAAITFKTLENLTTKIANDFKIGTVELSTEFDLPMERVSQIDFVETISTYTAGYECVYTRRKVKNFAWVSLPIVVNEIVPLKAELTLVLGFKDVAPYFEDMLFTVEKLVVPLDAALSSEEKKTLKEKLMASKSVYAVISDLLDIYENLSYIISCDIEVKYSGCVLKTDVTHLVSWKKR